MSTKKNLLFSWLFILVMLTACGSPKTPPTSEPSTTSPVVETQPVQDEITPTDTTVTTAMPTAVLTSTAITSTAVLTLTITGKIDAPKTWTFNEIQAMPQTKAATKNAKGKVENYSGISIVDFLKQVTLDPDAKSIGFVNASGKRISYRLGFIQSCQTCLLVYQNKKGLLLVITGIANPLTIDEIVKLQIY